MKPYEAHWAWTCSCGVGGLFLLVADPVVDEEAGLQRQAADMIQGHLTTHLVHPDPERFTAHAGPVKLTGKLRKPQVVVDWSTR